MLDDFVKEYLLECQEGLALFETQLLGLEKEPDSGTILSSIFRVVHSIKGSSGFLGFPKMAAVAHEGEELLGLLREGKLKTNGAIVSGLLLLIDAMRSILASIEATRTEGDRDDSALIERLVLLRSGDAGGPEPVETEPIAGGVEIRPEAPPVAAVDAPARRERAGPRGRRGKVVAEPPRPLPVSMPDPFEPPALPTSAAGESSIRVDVGLLDKLMNLVGELVLTRNQLLRCSILRDESTFQASTQRLNLITTELQEGMMKTRMQPIRNISSKLPRVVRDLALSCGKQAQILMEGEETELDKTISEAIKDPITHIVRNAIDHGIEPPEGRAARGKPLEGTLRLRAYHEGGMVNIELSDDGNGIDPERIRRKAVERGWLTEDQAAHWSERELIGLIFRPGFSTAESLTMVSGRGVGMDVVKSKVESIGGSVDATSRVGEGTTIKMKIPLTLSIINALIVSAGTDRFAIPQVNLVELVRLKGDSVRDSLIDMRGALLCRYRGKLLPLIALNEALKINRKVGPDDEAGVNIIVLQADRRQFGLIVDLIDDAQEIVVRPLSRQLKGISSLAGATIMGDGKIALILDVFGLAKHLEGDRDLAAGVSERSEGGPTAPTDDRHALLVLRGTDGSPLAIPLADVVRLESIPRSAVEWVGNRPLAQYRQSLLPLVDVAARLRGELWIGDVRAGDEGSLQVVIHGEGPTRAGLVFAKVLDIVQESLEVRGESRRPGVLLTAAIGGRATEILDVRALLDGAVPAPMSGAGAAR